jgi:DNA processing protein
VDLSEPDYHLAFSYCKGIGPKRFFKILEYFGKAEKAWKAIKNDWGKLGFPKSVVEDFFIFKEGFDFEKTKKSLALLEIGYLAFCEEDFPYLLKEIYDCPIGLFYKGNFNKSDDLALAVVGTRKVTPYGREVTARLVKGLVGNGFTIVSGLARGVDGIAHRVAIDEGGRTIAVLGTGLDVIYPPEHKQLASEIVRHGVLVSEYPPKSKIVPGNFPARNRIVSGLSLGVLVTEGTSKSGSKITALLAIEQNREVFAVPGPITNLMSEAPTELIQMGAKLVRNVNDILEELPVRVAKLSLIEGSVNESEEMDYGDGIEGKVLEIISLGGRNMDEIIKEINLPISEIMSVLTVLELSGRIKALGDGVYVKI